VAAEPQTKPALVKPKTPWYSLEQLVPYADLIAVIGAAMLLFGVAVIYWPLALVVGGALLMWVAWKMGQA
jgi:hypothetical protein